MAIRHGVAGSPSCTQSPALQTSGAQQSPSVLHRVHVPPTQAGVELAQSSHVVQGPPAGAQPAVFAVTQRLLAVAEPYYASAVAGLAALPWRSAWAIAAARGVYRQIGVEVLKRGTHAWDERVSTSTATKAWLALQGGAMAVGSRGRTSPERPALWSKI